MHNVGANATIEVDHPTTLVTGDVAAGASISQGPAAVTNLFRNRSRGDEMAPMSSTESARSKSSQFHGSINSLRGVVCLGIVFFHIFYLSGIQEHYPDDHLARALRFILNYCRLGFESFFVIAGFFLAHTFRPTEGGQLSVRRYAQRRLLRLAIPYWVVASTALAARWLLHFMGGDDAPPVSIWQAISVFFLAQDIVVSRWFPTSVLWSMAPLFQSYAVWTVSYWLIRSTALAFKDPEYENTTRRMMIFLSFITLIASIAIANRTSEDGWQLPGWGWAFAAGALTYWRTRASVGWASYGIAIGSLLPISLALNGPSLYAMKVVVCCLILLALDCGFSPFNGPITRSLSFIGSRSYSIYLVHGPVGVRLVKWLSRTSPIQSQPIACLEVLLASVVAIISGFFFYRVIERPTSRLAGLVEYRR